MGVARQWDYVKRMYFPDNMVVVASDNKSHYLQGLLAYRDMLGLADNWL